LRTVGLRHYYLFGNGYIFLVVLLFLTTVDLLQAQAKAQNVESGAPDRDTIKRIQEKAEDLGDSLIGPLVILGLKH